jgi:hypothetical protein
MITIFVINCLVVTLAVTVHYEFLSLLTRVSRKMRGPHRLRIVAGVLGAMLAHSIEIWIFALAYYWINLSGGHGSLIGNFTGSLLDCAYFSFTVFTTLGFGDIEPTGPLRFMVGLESLTGLLLIAWTASFLYYEMQRFWGENNTPH